MIFFNQRNILSVGDIISIIITYSYNVYTILFKKKPYP